jgi:hypothetical protein
MARMCLTERTLGCKGEEKIAQAIDSCTVTCAGLGLVEDGYPRVPVWRYCEDIW